MEFFRDSKIDFMGARYIWLSLSAVVFVAAMVGLFGLGQLNVGIDFAGGTQLTAKFAAEPSLDELRDLLEQAQIPSARIQRFGDVGANEVILKTRTIEGQEEGSEGLVIDAFDRHFNPDLAGRTDLNRQGTETLVSLLVSADPDGRGTEADPLGAAIRQHYGETASAVMGLRKDMGLITSWEQIEALPEVSAESLSMLREKASLGEFAVLAAESVGPQIGGELQRKGVLAVVFSLIGMLTYIWLRFELRFGIGALVALVHDVGIVFGLYAIQGYEFNLTTIAAFLTVVGYSVNDSVVVFDRVRENLRRNRREPLEALLNRSLNQTLSRTVLTSGTTLLVVTTLFIFGGDVIRGLAFVLMAGVVVGTYSSIFVASPTVLFWEHFFGRDARARRRAA